MKRVIYGTVYGPVTHDGLRTVTHIEKGYASVCVIKSGEMGEVAGIYSADLPQSVPGDLARVRRLALRVARRAIKNREDES